MKVDLNQAELQRLVALTNTAQDRSLHWRLRGWLRQCVNLARGRELARQHQAAHVGVLSRPNRKGV